MSACPTQLANGRPPEGITIRHAPDTVCICSHLTHGAFGEAGTREFFTHVRFHKHEGERIVVHLLAELYARSAEEAAGVLEEAARATTRSSSS